MYQIVSEPDVTDPGGVVPGFLSKLWKLVDDEDTDELICWSEDSTAFHVLQPNLMAKELLPYYFKHSNLSSFIRQLNMYGFKKMTTVDGGGLKGDKDEMIFQHPFFIRGNQHLLQFIKRKVAMKKEAGGALIDPNSNPRNYTEILQDVNQMKFKQAQMNAKLVSMRRENEDLWQEVAELRKKHNNQQTIVQRLIQFLLTMARGQRGFGSTHGGKRKQQLAISSIEDSGAKMAKYSREVSRSEAVANSGLDTLEDYASDLGENKDTRITDITDALTMPPMPPTHDYARSSGEGTSYTVESPASVDIQEMMLFPPTPELGDILDHQDHTELPNSGGAALSTDVLDTPVATPRPVWPQPQQQQQQQQPKQQQQQQPASTSLPRTATSPSRPPTTSASSSSPRGETSSTLLKNETRLIGETHQSTNSDQLARRNMTTDVLDLQDELDALRDLLAKGQFTLDASTLTGLFTPETTNQMAQHENQARRNIGSKSETGNISGNELVRYTEPYPDLLAFVETADDLDTALPTDHLTGEDDVIEALLAGENGPASNGPSNPT